MAEVRRRWGDDETAEEEKVKRGGWNGWGILPGCQSTTTVYPSRPCLGGSLNHVRDVARGRGGEMW